MLIKRTEDGLYLKNIPPKADITSLEGCFIRHLELIKEGEEISLETFKMRLLLKKDVSMDMFFVESHLKKYCR